MPKKRFFNQVVLVTGASMGIGREIALAFAREGAKLVLVARSKDKLEAVSKEVAALGVECFFLVTDVTHSQDLEYLLQKVEQSYGRLDILVNNAGKGLYSLVESGPLSELIDVMNVNLFGLVDLTRKALPLLRRSKNPSVVNISSVAGHFAVPRMSGYCASKGALNIFSEGLRLDWASYGIHVLSVYPGLTDTEFSNNAKAIDARPDSYVSRGRGIPASKVARKVLRAVVRKKREIYITFQNRAVVWTHFLFPRTWDWVLRKFVK